MTESIADPVPARRLEDIGPPPVPPPGPIAQSVAIGFRAAYVVVLVLVVVWLTSNVREIASDSQAVVRRFGRIVRSQEAGLLLAWPRPIETVQLLPGPERQLTQEIGALPAPSGRAEALITPAGPTGGGAQAPAVSAYLTGDGNVVVLSAGLIYHISDPVAYALSQDHVVAALNRLFHAATVRITAERGLNQFLVVEAANDANGDAGGDGTQAVTTLRAEVRDSLLRAVNGRLQELAAAGSPLGIEVERIDMTAYLPPEAKTAFDGVLLASQAADRAIAMARTDAERRRQEAAAESERLLSSAEATAKELISKASVDTSRISALEEEATRETRGSILLREYRKGIADIVGRTSSVTLVDPDSGARFVLRGNQK
ncbi:MAG TPA: SPFH domain-containing protein [Gammaproteobacteria bacterium]|nr:SPFH domain-containing protein [Gammaproteobacteria bacterium]